MVSEVSRALEPKSYCLAGHEGQGARAPRDDEDGELLVLPDMPQRRSPLGFWLLGPGTEDSYVPGRKGRRPSDAAVDVTDQRGSADCRDGRLCSSGVDQARYACRQPSRHCTRERASIRSHHSQRLRGPRGTTLGATAVSICDRPVHWPWHLNDRRKATWGCHRDSHSVRTGPQVTATLDRDTACSR